MGPRLAVLLLAACAGLGQPRAPTWPPGTPVSSSAALPPSTNDTTPRTYAPVDMGLPYNHTWGRRCFTSTVTDMDCACAGESTCSEFSNEGSAKMMQFCNWHSPYQFAAAKSNANFRKDDREKTIGKKCPQFAGKCLHPRNDLEAMNGRCCCTGKGAVPTSPPMQYATHAPGPDSDAMALAGQQSLQDLDLTHPSPVLLIAVVVIFLLAIVVVIVVLLACRTRSQSAELGELKRIIREELSRRESRNDGALRRFGQRMRKKLNFKKGGTRGMMREMQEQSEMDALTRLEEECAEGAPFHGDSDRSFSEEDDQA